MALANALAGLDAGVRGFEGSIGGIGGGIAMPARCSSIGNVAAEDLVAMLEAMGISTGVDVERAARTSGWEIACEELPASRPREAACSRTWARRCAVLAPPRRAEPQITELRGDAHADQVHRAVPVRRGRAWPTAPPSCPTSCARRASSTSSSRSRNSCHNADSAYELLLLDAYIAEAGLTQRGGGLRRGDHGHGLGLRAWRRCARG